MSKINEAVQKEIASKRSEIEKLKTKREAAINKLSSIQLDLVAKDQDLKTLVDEFERSLTKNSRGSCGPIVSDFSACCGPGPLRHTY